MAGKKTAVFDWDIGDFKQAIQGAIQTVEDAAALEQVVIKAHSTPRGVFLIYADPANPEKHHKYGSDVIAVALQPNLTADNRESELKRAIREALIYDPWIKDVIDITLYEQTTDGVTDMYADYTLVTVFDTKQQLEGVAIYAH